jgi:TrkA domain protein
MKFSSNTVPGVGTVHHTDTRRGEHLAVVVTPRGRTLVLYEHDDPDTPAHTVELDQAEADKLAEMLHSRPLAERLTAVERRLTAMEQRLAA